MGNLSKASRTCMECVQQLCHPW